MSPVLVGALLGSTVAYLKRRGKIPYTLEESLEIIDSPKDYDVTWNDDVEVIGDEVTWEAPAPKQQKVKFPRAKADKIVKKVEKHLKPYVDKLMACGSYRRGAQMIGDIDFVVILKEGYTLPQILPANQGVNWVGDQKAQVIIDGEKVDFRVTTPKAWGATILYFTGPADFNIKYRWMAKKRGMKLNEYGLFNRTTDAYIAGATEQDIYDALKRPFRDPDKRTGWKRAEEVLLHPDGGWDLQIDFLEEFPNAKNFDALLYQRVVPEIRTLNSMEELLSSDYRTNTRAIYYINFPLKVFRGVNIEGENQQWTWKRWLDGDKMGTSRNMGIDNTQPTTLNIQEALDYANGISRSPRDPEMLDIELYAIDIQDYFIKLPRPSKQYNHKNCNPVYKCPSCNMESDSILFDNACPKKPPQRYFVPSCNFKFASCDNPNHIKTETPVIFILGGAHYEDMTVLWDPDVKSSYFEAPYQPNQTLQDYSPQDLMTSSAITGDFTTDSLKYGFGPTSLSAEEIRCCKECDKTTGLTTIQEGTYCWDCLPINLGAEEMFYYHGTDMTNLASILKEGIRPTADTDSRWGEDIMDISPYPYYYAEIDDILPSVFVADSAEEARWWADESGIENIRVLKISSQVENLENFHGDGNGYKTSETIPKEYIVEVIDKTFDAEEIVCSKCDWSWQRSDGGDDLFTCHKCGFDNENKSIDRRASFDAEDNYDSTYGKAQAKIRRKLKNKIKKQAIMGTKAGQWSARKSQELKRQYETACEKKGLRPYKGNKTKSQDNLSKWSRQKWGTASGKKSSKTGEPYFPAKAIEALKDRGLYAKAKRQKQAATKAGKQHARYSNDIREVVKPFRSESELLICPLCHGYIPNDNTPGAYPGAMSRVFEGMEICSACGTAEALGPMFGPMEEIIEEAKEQGLSGLELWAYTISNVKEYLPKEFYGAESFEPISITEMDRYLRNKRFKPIDLVYRNRPVKEWVYERGLLGVPNHYVRVYTSINRYGRNQGRARDSGRDAIRVQVIYRDKKGETLVSAPKRVHRIGTWKDNLQKRLDVIAEELPKVMFDRRGEPMTLRKHKGNYFWGSRDYPNYKETRSYESETEIELSWQVVVVADPQDNKFYRAYQKVIEADNYNEIWEIIEMVDDLNLATKKIADTKFNERRVVVTIYTPGIGLTDKDDYWCEVFDEVLETLQKSI